MEVSFVNREGNGRLILIFTGWSTGVELYSTFTMSGWDIAIVHDYNFMELHLTVETDSAKISFHDLLLPYSTIYLFAWSLGVSVADNVLPPDRITAAFAINGTVNPVSDIYGIPYNIFKGTADTLNARNLQKFRRRMMPDAESFKALWGNSLENEEEIITLQKELDSFLTHHWDDHPHLKWQRAYIGQNDKIFPACNMLRAWQLDSEVNIIQSDDAHYMDIGAIIRANIADTFKVSQRFSKAMDTYDSYAISQQLIASRLARLIKSNLPSQHNRIIEIGPGTGYLTKLLSKFINPEEAFYVDIVKTGSLPVGKKQHYIQADAEQWIKDFSGTVDMIVSASCIQWFADIPEFLHNCSRMLRKGGLLAISTFLPGNLQELDTLRPSPLKYPTAQVFQETLKEDFDILELREGRIKMEFESMRKLLMHIRYTGVGGNHGNKKKNGSMRVPFSTLTYLPLYLIARKV